MQHNEKQVKTDEKTKILIVDDDENTCKILTLILGKKGYITDSVGTGHAAIKNLQKGYYDIVLLDIKLPDVEGTELITHVKDLQSTTVIMMMTAFASLETALGALNKGASAYITKPFNMEEVLTKIDDIIEKQHLVKEKKRLNEQLQRELIDRKIAEGRVTHTNAMLRTIRRINTLITKEKNNKKLLKNVCQTLVEIRGFFNAWIVLIDDDGNFSSTYESGLGTDFVPMAEHLKTKKDIYCINKALKTNHPIGIPDVFSTCGKCPLKTKYKERSGMSIRLEYGGKIYGVLVVSIPSHIILEGEEMSLFQEVSEDVAFGLYNLKMEKMLIKSEEKYRTILDTVEEGYYEVDIAGNFTFFNDSLGMILGYSKDELMGMNYREYLDIETAKIVYQFYNKVYRTGLPIKTVECENIRKDGTIGHIEASISLIISDTGESVGFRGIIRNISERKKNEKTLQQRTHDLGERVKELDCLLGVSKLLEEPVQTINEVFPSVIALIPPAWQYPEITCSRIVLERKTFLSDYFHQTPWKQAADIKVSGKQIGILEVYYRTEMPEIYEGPFLKEERNLINSLVRTIGEYIERRRTHKRRLRQSSILEAINKVLRKALQCETVDEVGAICIAVAQELTGSKFGFIGEVNKDGLFDTIYQAMTGWDACEIPETKAKTLIRDMEIRGFWGSVLKEGKSLIVNDPASHPDSVGTPEGHPPLTSFLGVPLMDFGKTFGMIALANNDSGYKLADQEAMESLSIAFVEAINNKRMEIALRIARNSFAEKVTERTRELYEEKQLIETIIEAIPNGILVLDIAGSLSLANEAFRDLFYRIFQKELTKDFNIHNQPDIFLFNEIKRLLSLETDINVLKDPKIQTFEPIKGLYIQIHNADIIIPGERSVRLGTIFELRDVTRFIEYDNLRKQFVSTVSHELRTPITSIGLSIGNLKEYGELLPKEEKDKLIEMISENSSVLSTMIGDLLLVSRIEAGGFKLEHSSYKLFEVLNNALYQMEPKREAKGIIIQVDDKPEIELVGDPKRITQIFRILLDNAIKYSPEKSTIKVNVENHYLGEYNPTYVNGVLIQVSDSGFGISEEALPHVFERFFRSHEQKETQGTGLGLSIARELVLLHHGEIFIESKLGKGSTFSVFLPVKQNLEEEI